MRAAPVLWPTGIRGWLPGLMISVPVALLLWTTRSSDEGMRTAIAAGIVIFGLPWVVPGMLLVATLSVPVYMWLHTQGPVPPVLDWLGATLLIGAVLGAHINAALSWSWLGRDRAIPESGIGDFLARRISRRPPEREQQR